MTISFFSVSATVIASGVVVLLARFMWDAYAPRKSRSTLVAVTAPELPVTEPTAAYAARRTAARPASKLVTAA